MFGNKNNKEFKRRDSVKIKNGLKHPQLNLIFKDWQGRVFEVHGRTVELELDSITLQNLSEEYLNHCEETNEYPHLITVPKEDLEFVEPRDHYDDVEKIQDEIIEKLDSRPSNEDELDYRKLNRKWARHFLRSNFYSEMEKGVRENSDFILETFSDYMYNYEGQEPEDWDIQALEEVCLNWVPNKISAEKDLFQAYGVVLIKFFEFLDSRKYLKTKLFQEFVNEIKDQIVEISQDSSNWGIAKSFMMGAQQSGVDLDNKEEMDFYLMQQQLRALSQIEEEKQIPQNNIIRNQYSSLGRNDKITVEYDDGTILENIKFKKVMQDLKNGTCKIRE